MSENDIGGVSGWSRSLVLAIGTIRRQARISNAELMELTGMKPNYFYKRMRFDAAFDTDEIARIAKVLNMTPLELVNVAARLEVEELVAGAPRQLARRLRVLLANPRADGSPFDVNELIARLSQEGHRLDRSYWEELLAGNVTRPQPSWLLNGISDYAGVSREYLQDLKSEAVADSVEAQLQLREALQAIGAVSIAARSVGNIPPDAVRAIAESIRLVD